MSRTSRTALQTAVDDGGYFIRRVVCFTATPSRDLPYAIGSFVTEASPPKGNGFAIDLQVLGNLPVLAASRGGQNDSAALAYLLRSGVRRDPLFDLLSVLRSEDYSPSNACHAGKIQRQIHKSSYL